MLKIPSVPFDTLQNIPFVPNPYSGVEFQMGGTTPPYKSVNSFKIYQDDAPRVQNSLSPIRNSDIYSGQNIGDGQYADWVRGNQFGVRYDESMINDRIKYTLNTPSIKENNKTYINYDQFYPIGDKTDKYENGYPTWRYPYSLRHKISEDIIENFSNSRFYFWIGIITIVSSLVFCKMLK